MRGERKVVAPVLLEVTLLPPAAVNERHLIEREGADRIRVSEVAEHRIGVQPRIANDVGHASLPPAVISRFMA
jgi:hypothetical protein